MRFPWQEASFLTKTQKELKDARILLLGCSSNLAKTQKELKDNLLNIFITTRLLTTKTQKELKELVNRYYNQITI